MGESKEFCQLMCSSSIRLLSLYIYIVLEEGDFYYNNTITTTDVVVCNTTDRRRYNEWY